MRIVAKYKFNQSTYADFIPTFNSTFTSYTITDEIGTDGYAIRTIESDDLPTSMRFGANSSSDRTKSLLEVFECNTNKVTNMSYMFGYCSNLTSLDLSSFNTENVTNMNYMFRDCLSLTSLNLLSFNTQNVTSMREMFYNCSRLTSLNLSSFNTENVTNMREMFYNCSSLTSLDLTSFNTENVTSMTSMFNRWTLSQKVYISSKWTLGRDFPPTFIIALAYTIAKYKFNQTVYESFLPTFNTEFTDYTYNDEIDTDGFIIRTIGNDSGNLPTLMRFGSSDNSGNGDYTKQYSLLEVNELNTNNVDGMSLMFYQCKNLIHINANFDTSNVNNMGAMFHNCSSLTSLDVSNFNTEKVENMAYMFNGCSSLTSLDVSNFNTEKVDNISWMFYNCSSLISLDVSNFSTQNVTNMDGMFYNCSSLTLLDVSNFNTEKVTSMGHMFQNCSKLTSLDISNFNTEKVTSMGYMFTNCSSLASLDVSNFNTQNVTTMQNIFNGCSLLTSLDVLNFNTQKTTNMNGMFCDCSSLTSIDVSNFNTEKVANMSWMFADCSSLTSLDVLNFNTENVTTMSSMFQNCSSLTSLDVSNFDTSQVTAMMYMFFNCSSLTLLDISNFKIDKNPSISSMFSNMKNIENIGMIYCSNAVINYLTQGLDGVKVNIWHSSPNSSELTQRNYITFKEYKMNILESDEEIELRRVGNVYDELNLETGELTQRVGKIVLDGSVNWSGETVVNDGALRIGWIIPRQSEKLASNLVCDKLSQVYDYEQGIRSSESGGIYLQIDNSLGMTLNEWVSQNKITVQYELETPIIKTINLKGKPSINWQGDTHLHLENNTLYPQLDCEVESINYYEIPKLKANTLYTLRYVGEPTQCIFGGLTYRTENNMVLTSGSSDNLLYFDKEVRKVILIEGDVRDRNFDYFEGIESLGAVEIITHKTNMPIFAKGGRK